MQRFRDPFLCQGVKVLKDNCHIELHLQVLCSLLVHIRPLLISYSPAACTCSAPLHHHPKGSTGKKKIREWEIFFHQCNSDGAEHTGMQTFNLGAVFG